MCPFVRKEHTRGSRGIITPDGTAQGPRFRLQFLRPKIDATGEPSLALGG